MFPDQWSLGSNLLLFVARNKFSKQNLDKKKPSSLIISRTKVHYLFWQYYIRKQFFIDNIRKNDIQYDLPCALLLQERVLIIPDPGLEPGRPRRQWILNPSCLPIPPIRLASLLIDEKNFFSNSTNLFLIINLFYF